MFASKTAPAFDALGAAATAADMTIRQLLQPARAARMVDFHRRNAAQPDFDELLAALVDKVFLDSALLEPREAEIARVVQRVLVDRLIELSGNVRRRGLGAIARRRCAGRSAAAHGPARGARPGGEGALLGGDRRDRPTPGAPRRADAVDAPRRPPSRRASRSAARRTTGLRRRDLRGGEGGRLRLLAAALTGTRWSWPRSPAALLDRRRRATRGSRRRRSRLAAAAAEVRLELEVVATYPHDPRPSRRDCSGTAASSTRAPACTAPPRCARSSSRPGGSLRRLELDPQQFAEGLALVGDRLFQLTYQSELGWVWDLETFTRVRDFAYRGEGWGLTFDGSSLIQSDGSSRLTFRSPVDFSRAARARWSCAPAGRSSTSTSSSG